MLAIDKPGDEQEKQAVRVGETVPGSLAFAPELSPPHMAGQPRIVKSLYPPSMLKKTAGKTLRKPSARKTPENVRRALGVQKSNGKPLEKGIRIGMEEAMGYDFSDVRIHADVSSDRISRALYAKALTVNNDIYFRKNEYRPDSGKGRQLLAHELTHVVQRKKSRKICVQRSPDGLLEQIAGGAEFLGDLASARWVWDPITNQLARWESELDRIGEQGSPTTLGSVLIVPVSMLFVVLQSIVGLLDLLARLNPWSLALRGAATSVRAGTGQYTREDFTRDALSVGEQALDIVTLGLRNAFEHLDEGIREGNAFRITQAVSEIALAALAIFGVFRTIRARSSAGRMAAAVADDSARPVDIIDRPGTIAENPPGGERFSVRESHGTNRFGEPEARYYAEAWLDEQGIFEGDFMLRRPAGELGVTPTEGSSGYVRSSQLRGGALYRQALEYLRRRHGGVRGLRGHWGHGDNLAAFNEAYARLRATGLGDAAAQRAAALETFTGRIAASEGYTRVRIESATFDAASNAFTEVVVVFLRP